MLNKELLGRQPKLSLPKELSLKIVASRRLGKPLDVSPIAFDEQGQAHRKFKCTKVQGCRQRANEKPCSESPSAFGDIKLLAE
ncbi:hypothetical protein H5410_004967, partial [Solanum commersonii]